MRHPHIPEPALRPTEEAEACLARSVAESVLMEEDPDPDCKAYRVAVGVSIHHTL